MLANGTCLPFNDPKMSHQKKDPPAISLVTLGVRDLEASLAFYTALGFVDTAQSNESIKFLRGANTVLGLYGRTALAEDAELDVGVKKTPTDFTGTALAMNRADEAAVDALFERALAAGAKPQKKPQKVFWGGYSGYFADPDGHLWEVAYNPYFALNAHGVIDLEKTP